ncbi:MAG: hypothetical protein AB7V16_03385 [Vulcanibacillus sp.]
MESWENKPYSLSEIIKLEYSIIKKYFFKLLLFTLLFTGPFYILITQLIGEFSLYGITFGALDMSNGFFEMSYQGINLAVLTSLEIKILIIGIILLEILAIPLAIASIIIYLGGVKEGNNLSFTQVIKRALARYWAIFRGSVSYFFFVVLILFFLGFVPLSLALIEGFSQRLIPIVLLAVLITPTLIYIMTRMSFYFATIIFEKGVMGIRKSWELVNGKKVIRLIALYFGIFAVDIIVILLFRLIFGVFGDNNLSILLNKLVYMSLLVTNVIYYLIIYFDYLSRENKTEIV